jgi:hypothetical protein
MTRDDEPRRTGREDEPRRTGGGEQREDPGQRSSGPVDEEVGGRIDEHDAGRVAPPTPEEAPELLGEASDYPIARVPVSERDD